MLKVVPLQKYTSSKKTLSEADIFEVWADKLKNKDVEKIMTIVKKFKKPLIYKVTAEKFSDLDGTVLSASKYIDLDCECDKNLIKEIRKKYKKLEIIMSYHNFKETPYDKELKKIATKILKRKPDIIKLALFALSVSDSFRILDFLQELNKKGIKAICIGMGEHGLLTRVAGDLFGNYMMYFALDKNTKTAPGQITIQEFKQHRNES